MSNYTRIPLHIQAPIAKSGPQKNPSWESARKHKIHEPEYKYQGDDRPNTHMMSVIRRNPDGTLDFEWAMNMVLDAIHNLSFPHALKPVDRALLTVVFPERFRNMEPMQANLMTQFSTSEKAKVKALVEGHLLEEENYNSGFGGGSVEGRSKTRDGTP